MPNTPKPLKAIESQKDKCKRAMLSVLDEIRAAVESGTCEGFVLSACIGGRPAREEPYTVFHRIPGLMPCEVVYLMHGVTNDLFELGSYPIPKE